MRNSARIEPESELDLNERIRVTVWMRRGYANELKVWAESRRSQGAVVELAMDMTRKDLGRKRPVVFKVNRATNGRLEVRAA